MLLQGLTSLVRTLQNLVEKPVAMGMMHLPVPEGRRFAPKQVQGHVDLLGRTEINAAGAGEQVGLLCTTIQRLSERTSHA